MENDKKANVVFLSTYPPRACGIATFTQDLVTELKKAGRINPVIAAISDAQYEYPSLVRFTLEQQDPAAYSELAKRIDSAGPDYCMIEHEYGIYGGKWGEDLLKLTESLTTPYFMTLHTVLPEPKKKQKEIICSAAAKSQGIITMAHNTKQILTDTYGIEKEKIAVIHHGVPNYPISDRGTLKKEEGFSGRFVVSTFGLISPGKGLEYGIEAIARVAKKHPEVLYLILGQTHPVVKKRDGEKYRESLENTVKKLGIENNVRFVNRYLTKEEIIRYLCLSDVYMTPYLSKDQAVSGTLAYAVGYGRVIVSTPYLYAQEMLADGRGLLAEFRSAGSLADCVLQVMENPGQKAEMENRTLQLGRTMLWNNIAAQYAQLFTKKNLKGPKEWRFQPTTVTFSA